MVKRMKEKNCKNCHYGRASEKMVNCHLNPPVISDILIKTCIESIEDASFEQMLEWGSVFPRTDPDYFCQHWKKN